MHILGDNNCRGDLLPRWVTRPGRQVCVHTSLKYAEVLVAGIDQFLTKEVVRGVQAVAAGDGRILGTALGVAG